jgi:hypothetical protein
LVVQKQGQFPPIPIPIVKGFGGAMKPMFFGPWPERVDLADLKNPKDGLAKPGSLVDGD